MPKREVPSTIAASSISLGNPSKNCFISSTCAPTTSTTITDHGVLRSPMSRKIR
jgi:hypothetical protein